MNGFFCLGNGVLAAPGKNKGDPHSLCARLSTTAASLLTSNPNPPAYKPPPLSAPRRETDENGGAVLVQNFRMLSGVLVEGHWIDFNTHADSLFDANAVKLFDDTTVHVDHGGQHAHHGSNWGPPSVVNWIGMATGARRTEEPMIGIDADFRISAEQDDKRYDGAICRGLLFTPPAINCCSVTVYFDGVQSHPDMDSWDFWCAMGTKVDGRIVCYIATRFKRITEVSLVYAGADPLARSLGEQPAKAAPQAEPAPQPASACFLGSLSLATFGSRAELDTKFRELMTDPKVSEADRARAAALLSEPEKAPPPPTAAPAMAPPAQAAPPVPVPSPPPTTAPGTGGTSAPLATPTEKPPMATDPEKLAALRRMLFLALEVYGLKSEMEILADTDQKDKLPWLMEFVEHIAGKALDGIKTAGEGDAEPMSGEYKAATDSAGRQAALAKGTKSFSQLLAAAELAKKTAEDAKRAAEGKLAAEQSAPNKGGALLGYLAKQLGLPDASDLKALQQKLLDHFLAAATAPAAKTPEERRAAVLKLAREKKIPPQVLAGTELMEIDELEAFVGRVGGMKVQKKPTGKRFAPTAHPDGPEAGARAAALNGGLPEKPEDVDLSALSDMERNEYARCGITSDKDLRDAEFLRLTRVANASTGDDDDEDDDADTGLAG